MWEGVLSLALSSLSLSLFFSFLISIVFLAGVGTDLLLSSSPVPVASQGFLQPSRHNTAEGLGRWRWGCRFGGVGWVSCSLSLSYYRFMGAQSFSKYLPFPLYCGRLMAFDVGGGGWVGLEVHRLWVQGWRTGGAYG